jgi:segregation and condensation protein B
MSQEAIAVEEKEIGSLGEIELYVEALVFSATQSMRIEDISKALTATFEQDFSDEEIDNMLFRIQEKYDAPAFAIQLTAIAEGWSFMTKVAYHRIISEHLRITERKNLSKSALETLAIIAYRQPITKHELESIRGVSCDYAIQKLLEKELVEIIGRRDTPGRPLEYGTTLKFLNHFGLKDKRDLPTLKEFDNPEETIGVIESEEE